jgi:ferrochelatase
MTDTEVGVVLMAYGTPRSTDDILRYYTDIRRGTPPTDEQLAALVDRYRAIGGTSPLAERTEAQRAALQRALDSRCGGRYRVVLGMKHSAPSIEDAVASLAASGIGDVVGLVLAPHYSAASVGGYLERLAAAAATHDITVRAITSWATEGAFVEFVAADLAAKLTALPAETRVVFTAHSLPIRSLAPGDPYVDEVQATAAAVAAACGIESWTVAWQSQGRTSDVWLAPDVLNIIDALGADGQTRAVLISAIGFVADHLEVLYDLDIAAAGRAADHGLEFARTACVNDDPTVMAALADRVIAA